VPKLPLPCASDVLNLIIFLRSLLEAKVCVRTCVLLFLCAHHIRTPSWVRRLRDVAVRWQYDRLTAVLLALHAEMQQEPFTLQKSGLPYFIGPASLHTGVPQVRKWLSEKHEVKLLVAAESLLAWAKGDTNPSECMAVLLKLPGMKEYAYHVIRSWGAACEAMMIWKVPGCIKSRVALLRRVVEPEVEEESASNMSSHVSVIIGLLNASGEKLLYPAAVPPWVRQNQELLPGEKALLACELAGFGALCRAVPPQSAFRGKSLATVAGKIDRKRLHALANFLETATKLSWPSSVSPCRQENLMVEAAWPEHFEKHATLRHSSMAIKNLVVALPRAIKRKLNPSPAK